MTNISVFMKSWKIMNLWMRFTWKNSWVCEWRLFNFVTRFEQVLQPGFLLFHVIIKFIHKNWTIPFNEPFQKLNCYFCLRLGLGGNWEGPQKQFSVETERQGLKAAWTASEAAGMVSAATKMVSAAVGLVCLREGVWKEKLKEKWRLQPVSSGGRDSRKLD